MVPKSPPPETETAPAKSPTVGPTDPQPGFSPERLARLPADVRAALIASWEENEAVYRYLGR